MTSLARVEWYWKRLRYLSVTEIVEKAGTASQVVKRRRPPEEVPMARVDRLGARWVPDATPTDGPVIVRRADEILLGRWQVLARGAMELGFPPEWNRNPDNGALLPMGNGKLEAYRHAEQWGDLRYLYEPNRHLELVVLAQAWRITGSRRYLEGIATLLESWFIQCPHSLGPNWSSTHEVAIRLMNWATVWQLLGGMFSPLFDRPVGKVLRADWLSSVWRHAEFIRTYPSRPGAAHHERIGEMAALYVAGACWPCWDESRTWRHLGRAGLEEEVARQIGTDGVHREQATALHQVVWDYLLTAGLAARASGRDFSSSYWRSMEAMLDYVAGIMDAGGRVPRFGDGDDSRVNGLGLAGVGCGFHSQLATGAILFSRSSFARKAGVLDERTRWTLGTGVAARFDELLLKAAPATFRTDFPEGGVYVLGSALDTPGEFRVVADAGPLGMGGMAGHGHADALSFTLSMAGRAFLIDPGTGTYHGQRHWREGFRGTAMHNTLSIGGENQAVPGGRFMWLRKYRSTVIERESQGAVDRLVAEHDGYRRLPGRPIHRRSWEHDRSQGSLKVTDQVDASHAQDVTLHWHFSEDCHLTCTPDGLAVTNGPIRLEVSLPEAGEVSILYGSDEPLAGWVSSAYDQRAPSTTVVWRGRLAPGESVETCFRRV